MSIALEVRLLPTPCCLVGGSSLSRHFPPHVSSERTNATGRSHPSAHIHESAVLSSYNHEPVNLYTANLEVSIHLSSEHLGAQSGED